MGSRRILRTFSAALVLALMTVGLSGCGSAEEPGADTATDLEAAAPSPVGDWWLANPYESGSSVMVIVRFQLLEDGTNVVTSWLDDEQVETYETTWSERPDGGTFVNAQGDSTSFVLGSDDSGNEVLKTGDDGGIWFYRTRELALQAGRARPNEE